MTMAALAPSSCGAAQQLVAIGGARQLYLLRCGGCHGIQGVSVPKSIPTLRGRAGVFLCSPAARDFMLRLPNIQMSLIRDDADLAAVMNFVAFDLGGASTPPGAPPFTALEVAKTRGRPLDVKTLSSRHDALIAQAGACAAPYQAKPPS
jgi:hypothetical protein